MASEAVIGGRYRVVRKLGSGSYGRVFEAIAPDGLHVAVKVIREALVETEARTRFEREADILRGLDHEHIVRVVDSGYTGEGQSFIVFELLLGRSLADELKRVSFMSCSRVAGIARQILRALDCAHRNNVVHRDIKPGNVHLCSSATDVDLVKVLDFGVAKPMKQGELERLTEAGVMVGTPGYMAPEQIRGEPVIGPPADLFSLGMMMARLLSGERFIGETIVEVIRLHMGTGPIAVPHSVELSELWPVVQCALQRRAADRFQTAPEMLAAIELAMCGVQSGPRSAAGTLLMPEHLQSEVAPNSTVPIEDMPWLRNDAKDD
jgi:serine/threonine protein kinase